MSLRMFLQPFCLDKILQVNGELEELSQTVTQFKVAFAIKGNILRTCKSYDMG